MTFEQFKQQTVLVTGATGFVGGALCQRLNDLGIKTLALARREGRDKYIRDLEHVEIIMGDITDAERMKAVAQKVDIVIHVAAALEGDLVHQRKVNVQGTKNIVKASLHADIKRFIHISTLAVYGYDLDGDITEEHPLSPSMEAYSLSKAEAEKILIEHISDLPYSIIRPGGIYGARSGMWLDTMFHVAKRKPMIFVGNGSGYAPLVYIDDLCDLIIEACWRDEAVGEAFNAIYDDPYTWREYLGSYSALVGHQSWVGIPMWLVRPFISFASRFGKPYSQLKVAPQAINFLDKQIRFRSEKATRILGWTTKTNLHEGVKVCEADLRERGLLK